MTDETPQKVTTPPRAQSGMITPLMLLPIEKDGHKEFVYDVINLAEEINNHDPFLMALSGRTISENYFVEKVERVINKAKNGVYDN